MEVHRLGMQESDKVALYELVTGGCWASAEGEGGGEGEGGSKACG